jgi:hypothetical protein
LCNGLSDVALTNDVHIAIIMAHQTRRSEMTRDEEIQNVFLAKRKSHKQHRESVEKIARQLRNAITCMVVAGAKPPDADKLTTLFDAIDDLLGE